MWWVAIVMGTTFVSTAPGTTFQYCSGSDTMLSVLIGQANKSIQWKRKEKPCAKASKVKREVNRDDSVGMSGMWKKKRLQSTWELCPVSHLFTSGQFGHTSGNCFMKLQTWGRLSFQSVRITLLREYWPLGWLVYHTAHDGNTRWKLESWSLIENSDESFLFVISSLFPDVVNCMQTDNLELKKLVYLYLMNYAKSQPDMAIMAVNSFVKARPEINFFQLPGYLKLWLHLGVVTTVEFSTLIQYLEK